MTVQYALYDKIDLFVPEHVSPEDADRQKRTADAILKRLTDQPGMILADEVGMGKTFVALAVAVSVALENRGGRPVVVMVPSSLKEKWPRDCDLFLKNCLPEKIASQLKYGRAEKAVDFLKFLDDPKPRRCSLIFMTHGAMSRGLDDPWIKLALIQRSLHRRRNTENLKWALGRNLGDLLQMKWLTNRDENIWSRLLHSPPSKWLEQLTSEASGPNRVDDDPVPEAIANLLHEIDTTKIFEAIQRIPKFRNASYQERLKECRQVLADALRSVWKDCLERFKHRLPLLILDEAHHLKNSGTRLATLFQSEDSQADGNEISQGPLANIFERMLFLTATPFQLGHGELCSVLDRFDAVHWTGKSAPSVGRAGFVEARTQLRESLDRAQASAVCLDSIWGRLTMDDLRVGEQCFHDVDSWWAVARNSQDLVGSAAHVVSRFVDTQKCMADAQKLLHPWVIRHLKLRHLPGLENRPRRERRAGAAILLNGSEHGREAGLSVSGEAMLPFLLASRASACSPTSRPVFAEGLASSYEAFLHTRNREGETQKDEDDSDGNDCNENGVASWYLDKLDSLIPKSGSIDITHPKMDATVNRVIDNWMLGEKTVVFCHYVQTGRALRRQISDALNSQILKLGSDRLQCPGNLVADELKRIGARFFDEDGPARRTCDDTTMKIVDEFPSLSGQIETLLQIVRRNLRTPAFLVRYYPIGKELIPEDAIRQAFESQDQSGITLREMLRQFCKFLVNRCGESQRIAYIDAVRRIQTGAHFGLENAAEYDDDELQGDHADHLLPNVRLINGRTRSETRQRLMLTFNTPFYPEILVASSVMSEGVDLHLNCRHMIHHDLCWNPSNLEQRTGRIDRIGAKAEKAGEPIQVFLPYIAETQDEKMYRVVMDRERWFNVVMGEKYTVDAATTEKLANRVQFPSAAALELAFKLEEWIANE